jgi:hypothetical protein
LGFKQCIAKTITRAWWKRRNGKIRCSTTYPEKWMMSLYEEKGGENLQNPYFSSNTL